MKTTFYVVFDAEIRGGKVQRVRPVRMVKSPPALGGGEVAVRFEADLPETAFLRLMPVAEVTVPDGWWTSQTVTVHVPDPPSDDALPSGPLGDAHPA